jgi:hypothetical protein
MRLPRLAQVLGVRTIAVDPAQRVFMRVLRVLQGRLLTLRRCMCSNDWLATGFFDIEPQGLFNGQHNRRDSTQKSLLQPRGYQEEWL